MPTRDEDEEELGIELEDPPSTINPYEVLEVDEKATSDQIKSAYRKAALRHHPDKAAPDAKPAAHKKFQEVALAYAILSDERRRRRYDTTGSTEESLDLEDDDFNWADFYREQFSNMVDGTLLDKIKREYQGSEEEKSDVLKAYEKGEGRMDMVYEVVMMSNVLDDDERFRAIIQQAIADGEVRDWPAFSEESNKSKKERVRKAKREAEEAMELAEELGVTEKLFGASKKGRKGNASKSRAKGASTDQTGEAALMALIQQRQKNRSGTFLDHLEAKYAPKSGKTGKTGRKRSEPPEEAFQRTADNKNQRSKRRKG
ncbi:hypothetical protein FQN57_002845 [Myotisia sp. PD_48]|nr:hypothetical protein FQN57_002845 [Myotisia sp. PD_48]